MGLLELFEVGVDEGLKDFGDFFFVFGLEQDVGTGVELVEELLDFVDVGLAGGLGWGFEGLEGGKFLGEVLECLGEVLLNGGVVIIE